MAPIRLNHQKNSLINKCIEYLDNLEPPAHILVTAAQLNHEEVLTDTSV